MKDCIFCTLANKDKEKKIYENDNFFSVLDVNPVTIGHCLVISKKHFKTTLDMPNTLGDELLDCIKNTALKTVKDTNSEGFKVVNNNFSAAGQVIHHVHFHIIPRKKGDGVKL